MSDKYSSNTSRIIPLVFGFLVLFVVTFSLGVIVGKGLSDRKYKAAELEKNKTEENILSDNKNSLDEELIALKDETPVPTPEPQIQNQPGESDLAVNEEVEEDVLVEATPVPEPVPEKTPEPTIKPTPAATPVPTIKPTPKPTKVPATPEPEQDSREAAIEEIAKNKDTSTRRRVKLPPIDPHGTYTVQIGSFTDKKAADSVLRSMKSKGYPAFINTKTDSNNKKWYRVRIGTFNQIESATEYGDNLKILEPQVKIVFITKNN